ncbi:LysR family transcriptional regulator [Bordetella bronchiseptica]|uniref:LysR family transcriptional regulator n=1 Tax=Bordetella bronchiseptica TaxID=518 RepID=UPI00028B714C|nr:LysR family transcriptional regulator [Bordetella bronchiseptica]AWQ08112.1 LysR family transcriptional regulator [Bordetella bronchiseptica]AZW33556.1 LysR family transcriptional regulator [Bordetella bronchiseptica]QET69969.1 LysR family transcriptional regulator [Bordetella bronchiseptica]CCJ61229.1 LysR-family transcriptional regulator [Bordetella bronchiseptica MO149]CCN03168.1 LysR-family transcriptional regulator [Bordetella bronchiseptica Bbr77]
MLSRITLRQLEYCLAAGDYKSIAEAAACIHVSPSSISAAIAHIESELDAQVFVRHHAQGLSTTPLGEDLLKQMRGVLDQTSGLYGIVSDAQSSIRGPLRVGCFTTLAAMVTPELCQGFSRAHPQVQVTHVEDHHEGLIERLYKGQIDVAVTYDLEVQGTDITFEPLATLPPHVIVGETSPLAQQRVVDLKGLAEHPMVLLDLPRSREYFFGLFHAQQLEPLVAARSGSPDVVRSLVANGVGYSLVNVRPRMSHSLDGKRVLSLRLAGKHQPMRLGMAWIPVPRPRRVLEAFMQRCRTYISDEHVPGMVAPSHFMWSPQAEPASGDTA